MRITIGRVTGLALLLVAIHAVLTVIRVGSSWWWQDDLNMLAIVADRPLSVDLVIQDYNGHLQPASWLMAWLVTHFAPFAWWPAVTVQTGLVVATDVALLLLLQRLFGSRPAILVPLAAFCASTVPIAATVWWAAGMQWLPVMLSLALALYFHVGYVDSGRRRDAVGAVAAVAGGLFAFEKALTVVTVIVLVTVLYLVPGPFLRRPWRELRQRPKYWAAQGVLAAGYSTFYLIHSTATDVFIHSSATEAGAAPRPGLVDTLRLGSDLVFQTLLPSILGGPLEWYAGAASGSSWPMAPSLFLHLTWLIGAIVVIGSVMARRGAWRAWLIMGIYLAATVVMLSQARGGFIGPSIGRDVRYSTDLALLAPLCAALAWLPLRVGPAGDEGQVNREKDVIRNWTLARPRVLVAGAAVIVVLFTVGGFISGNRFMDRWTENPGEEYLENVRAGLSASDEPVDMFDQSVPRDIMVADFGDKNHLSHVIKPMAIQPRFVTWSPHVSIADPLGRIRKATVFGTASPLYAPLCGRTELVVPLASDVMDWAWKVKLTYTSNVETPAIITIGTGKIPVVLQPGQHDVFASFVGGGTTVKISGINPDARVCVSSAVVGDLLPMPE